MKNIYTRFQTALGVFLFGLSTLMGLTVFSPALVSAEPAAIRGSNSTASSEVCAGIGGCDSNQGAGLDKTVGFVVKILSVLLGVAAVIMIIISGFKFVVSGGDSNEVSNAKKTIIYALVGLIVAVLARPIVSLVLKTF